jgi:multisubunit Na+/H+ antiporter MnhE subunit
VRHLRAWVVAWVVLYGLWFALVGEWNAYEWVAGAAAAAAAAAVGVRARSRAGVAARLPPRRLVDLATVPAAIVWDFALLMGALAGSAARRRVVRGSFHTRPLAAGGDDARGTAIRAWTAIVATISPNAYVVDIDRGHRLALVHDIVPSRFSEKPL